MEKLTKQGQEMWDNLENFDEASGLFINLVKEQTDQPMINRFKNLVEGYRLVIKEQEADLKGYILKEQYFKANQCRVTIYNLNKVITDILTIVDPSDVIEVETNRNYNVTLIK